MACAPRPNGGWALGDASFKQQIATPLTADSPPRTMQSLGRPDVRYVNGARPLVSYRARGQGRQPQLSISSRQHSREQDN
jgi:hypothetical protein